MDPGTPALFGLGPAGMLDVSAPLRPKNLVRRGRAASPWTFPAITACFRPSPLDPAPLHASPGNTTHLIIPQRDPDGDATGTEDSESDNEANETQWLVFKSGFGDVEVVSDPTGHRPGLEHHRSSRHR